MPLYEYRCEPCKKERTDIRRVDERAFGPECDRCRKMMNLVVSAVAGIVKNPAVPRGSK